MRIVSNLSPLTLVLCLLAALGWVLIPYVMQQYLEMIIANPDKTILSTRTGILVALVLLVAIVEFLRFHFFSRSRPFHGEEQSIGSKLSQDRLWTTDVPNFLSNCAMVLGALGILLFRDPRISTAVIFWFLLTYSIQFTLSNRIKAIAFAFQNCGANEMRALRHQEDILRWQTIGSCTSSILRILGQLLLYATLFTILARDREFGHIEEKIPILLANLEYAGIALGSLQALSSSLPRLRELAVYLSSRASTAPNTTDIQS